MISLHRFFINPFDDEEISLDELLAFSTDHLQRMIANNPGAIFAARIVATTASLGVVESCTTDNMIKLSLRKAAKTGKKQFRAALPANMQSVYGMVLAHFAQNSPQMDQIFNEGRSIFTTCADDKLKMHLETTLAGVTAHVAVLGAPLVADVTGLLTTWNALYAASEASTGAATTTQEGKLAARMGLQLDLYLNLATLMLNFPRQPEKLPLYMRQDLLENHPAGLPLPGEPELVLQDTAPGSVTFSASASDAGSFTYWKRLVGETVFILVAEDVPPGDHAITGLAAGDYEFKVNAVNTTGIGPDSNFISVTIS
jgi:hypothetical protein